LNKLKTKLKLTYGFMIADNLTDLIIRVDNQLRS